MDLISTGLIGALVTAVTNPVIKRSSYWKMLNVLLIDLSFKKNSNKGNGLQVVEAHCTSYCCCCLLSKLRSYCENLSSFVKTFLFFCVLTFEIECFDTNEHCSAGLWRRAAHTTGVRRLRQSMIKNKNNVRTLKYARPELRTNCDERCRNKRQQAALVWRDTVKALMRPLDLFSHVSHCNVCVIYAFAGLFPMPITSPLSAGNSLFIRAGVYYWFAYERHSATGNHLPSDRVQRFTEWKPREF